MANTIKISDRMAEALTDTALTEDGKTVRLTSRVRPGTTCALMDRGLVRYDRELTRENGYDVHTLTPRGMNVRERLLTQSDGREFLASVVDAAARKPEPVTEAPEEPEDLSVRAVTLRVIQEHIAATQVPPVEEYSVKIWYRSGAYEGAPHCPEDLARKIYADAAASDGVEFAELHGPSGKLVESKTPSEETHVTTEPTPEPQENLFLAGLPLLHPEPLPPAPELPEEPEPTA